MDKTKIVKIIIGLAGLYLLSGAISFLVFANVGKTGGPLSPTDVGKERGRIDLSAPKTESCPLNGKMFTRAEREIWEARRPLGVMIENHEESRPQSGLSQADVVYEAIAEGGITRFLAVFLCGASAEEVTLGPVRSARTYYLDWISEYGSSPLYTHVGGANKPGPTDALGQIKKYGWDSYNDLNQFSIGFPTFRRDYERLGRPVATEHTMYSTTDKLWEVAQERNLTEKDKNGKLWSETFKSWKFKDASAASNAASPGQVAKISFPFWEGYSQYSVIWNYDSTTNMYKRVSGESPHTDLNNNEQLSASSVVVMFTTVKGPINELKHMLYTTTGTGKALIFQNGQVVEGTWNKPAREERTVFKSKDGKESEFVRGQIWIEVLQNNTKVEY